MKAIPRLQKCGNCLVRASTHHVSLATIPSSFLRVGSALRLGSPCLWDSDQIAGDTNCCIVQVTSRDILVQNAHLRCEDGPSQCRTHCPLLRNTVTWPLQSGLNNSSAMVSVTALLSHSPGIGLHSSDLLVSHLAGPKGTQMLMLAIKCVAGSA